MNYFDDYNQNNQTAKGELWDTGCGSPILFGHLYKLRNGDYIRISSTFADEDDYNYEYDYFDGKTKRLLDGGVFYDRDSINSEEVLETALQIWGCDPEDIETAEFIDENVEYDDLERLGFSGF